MVSKIRILALYFLSLSLVFFTTNCDIKRDGSRYTELAGEVFHTYYHIKYDIGEAFQQEIDSVFRSFSRSLNPFDSTSLISAINRSESTDTDSMLRHVWRAAYEISQRSKGSYDVTCAPFINAWGFGFDNKVSPKMLDSLKTFVGYEKFSLVGTNLVKEDTRSICDLSSISKGYCSDLVGTMLQEKGANNYLVELGGEIAFAGKNPQGQSWRIGINKPIEDSTGAINELELIINLDRERGGIATSGNYRNFKIVDGKKVAHTINPQTGLPIQTDVLSATILAPTCMLADGLATACMTMTSAQVPAFIAQFEDVEYLLILSDKHSRGFTTIMSEGMKRLVSIPN